MPAAQEARTTAHPDAPASLWTLTMDVWSAKVLIWIASAGRDAMLTEEAYLFLFDRYRRLADLHRARGPHAASETAGGQGRGATTGRPAATVRHTLRCLVVYSDSPKWREHVESRWLSRMGSIAATLNWSERQARPRTLESRLFHHFLGHEMRNFNPAVVVLRGLRGPLIFRFYDAFRESRAGRPQYLHALEEQMFRALEEEDGG